MFPYALSISESV